MQVFSLYFIFKILVFFIQTFKPWDKFYYVKDCNSSQWHRKVWQSQCLLNVHIAFRCQSMSSSGLSFPSSFWIPKRWSWISEERIKLLKEYSLGDKKAKKRMAKHFGKDELRDMMHFTQSQSWLHSHTKRCPKCKCLIQVTIKNHCSSLLKKKLIASFLIRCLSSYLRLIINYFFKLINVFDFSENRRM